MTWYNPTSRKDIEDALLSQDLYVAMSGGQWWRVRRNGRTQTWARAPERFSIPVKCGLKQCFRIDETSNLLMLRIAASREDAETKGST